MTNDSKSGIHIITFTETWLHGQVTDAKTVNPGYKIFRKDFGIKDGGVSV